LSVKTYFERTADNFDALYEDRRNLSYYFNHLCRLALFQRIEKTLKAFEGMADFTVLDVGCGSGRNSALFIEHGARRVVGVDFSAPMLQLAEEYTRNKHVADRCEFIQADFLEYPFTQKFDFVVALGVFDYVADPVRALRRMNELAERKVIASFPGVSPVRAPLRKIRYALRGCPVYFYTGTILNQICLKAGLVGFRIERVASSGYMLTARTRS
jgi:ubiquinone/menaquinone biosynthesis C-methylase UbiE